MEGNIFRKGKKCFLEGKVNVISLKGLNPKTQKRVAEIILSVLWRKVRVAGTSSNRFILIIDEFQNMDFHKDTAFFQMLTEARKYGISLILATQTLTIFNKKELAIINQAAVKLFFRQSNTDATTVASLIDPKHSDKWVGEILRLKIGQAITVGEIEIGKRQIMQPIMTYSGYQKEENLYIKNR